MIYYSNSELHVPHMTFIGRWSPFHKGHVAMIQKKLRERPNTPVLILIRNTRTDAYSPASRAAYIKLWMMEQKIFGTIMIVPNIEGVYWGRNVGYETEYVDVEKEWKDISGTDIRHTLYSGKPEWRKKTAHEPASYMLSGKPALIVEKGLVVWLTGCPASGKTTLAHAFTRRVTDMYPHLRVQVLDGDVMRSSPLAIRVGFTAQERAEHIHRMGFIAKMFADHGILVVCAFVSPERSVRTEAKKIIGMDRFVEVYVKASKKTRMMRDTKGLYKMAREGKLRNLTGYNADYEPPRRPSVTIDTNVQSIETSIEHLVAYVFR